MGWQMRICMLMCACFVNFDLEVEAKADIANNIINPLCNINNEATKGSDIYATFEQFATVTGA